MLLGEIDFLVNPPQERWNEIVATIYADRMWKVSIHDYASFLEGYGKENYTFIVAVDKETNKAVGSISGTNHPSVNGSPQVFVIGMYYTIPELRSHGLGKKLFDMVMGIAEGNLFLNSAPEMAQKYAERSGFDKIDSWQIGSMMPDVKDCDLTKLEVDLSIRIVDFEEVDIEKLSEYDRSIAGGIDRRRFLKKWLTQPEAYNKFATDETGAVIGYCNARITCGDNILIEPFYADNTVIASALLRRTLERIPQFYKRNKLVCYFSSENLKGIEMFKRIARVNLSIEKVIPRQFTKEIIETRGDKVYSVAEAHTAIA